MDKFFVFIILPFFSAIVIGILVYYIFLKDKDKKEQHNDSSIEKLVKGNENSETKNQKQTLQSTNTEYTSLHDLYTNSYQSTSILNKIEKTKAKYKKDDINSHVTALFKNLYQIENNYDLNLLSTAEKNYAFQAINKFNSVYFDTYSFLFNDLEQDYVEFCFTILPDNIKADNNVLVIRHILIESKFEKTLKKLKNYSYPFLGNIYEKHVQQMMFAYERLHAFFLLNCNNSNKPIMPHTEFTDSFNYILQAFTAKNLERSCLYAYNFLYNINQDHIQVTLSFKPERNFEEQKLGVNIVKCYPIDNYFEKRFCTDLYNLNDDQILVKMLGYMQLNNLQPQEGYNIIALLFCSIRHNIYNWRSRYERRDAVR
ncbi:hypothetical protein COBT_001621, partial [Conglomerata obtusa]